MTETKTTKTAVRQLDEFLGEHRLSNHHFCVTDSAAYYMMMTDGTYHPWAEVFR